MFLKHSVQDTHSKFSVTNPRRFIKRWCESQQVTGQETRRVYGGGGGGADNDKR